MEPLERIYAALEAADAAGNTEDARQLALMYREAENQPPTAPAEDKPYAGFGGSFKDAFTTLGLADEFAAFQANPTEETRDAFLKAGESKYKTVGFGEGQDWEAFKEVLGGSLGAMALPVAAGAAAAIPAGLGTAAATAATVAGAPAAPVTGLISAGTAGKAGYSAVAAPQYFLQNALRQAGEQKAAGLAPEDFSFGDAALAAAGQTGLDVLEFSVLGKMFRAFPILRSLAGRESSRIGESVAEAAANNTLKSVGGGVAKGVAGGVAFEVPQEIAQSALERWQAGLSLDDDSAMEEYKQSAYGALALAPLFGGAGGAGAAIQHNARVRANTPEPATEDGTTPIEDDIEAFTANPSKERYDALVSRYVNQYGFPEGEAIKAAQAALEMADVRQQEAAEAAAKLPTPEGDVGVTPTPGAAGQTTGDSTTSYVAPKVDRATAEQQVTETFNNVAYDFTEDGEPLSVAAREAAVQMVVDGQDPYDAVDRAVEAEREGTLAPAPETTLEDLHNALNAKGIKWDDNPAFMKQTKALYGVERLDDLSAEQRANYVASLDAPTETATQQGGAGGATTTIEQIQAGKTVKDRISLANVALGDHLTTNALTYSHVDPVVLTSAANVAAQRVANKKLKNDVDPVATLNKVLAEKGVAITPRPPTFEGADTLIPNAPLGTVLSTAGGNYEVTVGDNKVVTGLSDAQFTQETAQDFANTVNPPPDADINLAAAPPGVGGPTSVTTDQNRAVGAAQLPNPGTDISAALAGGVVPTVDVPSRNPLEVDAKPRFDLEAYRKTNEAEDAARKVEEEAQAEQEKARIAGVAARYDRTRQDVNAKNPSTFSRMDWFAAAGLHELEAAGEYYDGLAPSERMQKRMQLARDAGIVEEGKSPPQVQTVLRKPWAELSPEQRTTLAEGFGVSEAGVAARKKRVNRPWAELTPEEQAALTSYIDNEPTGDTSAGKTATNADVEETAVESAVDAERRAVGKEVSAALNSGAITPLESRQILSPLMPPEDKPDWKPSLFHVADVRRKLKDTLARRARGETITPAFELGLLMNISSRIQAGFSGSPQQQVRATQVLTGLVDAVDAGTLTPAEFLERTRQLALRMVRAADDKAHNQAIAPRKRGANIVREKLLAAVRRGELDQGDVDFALWVISQNPAMAEGLGISVRAAPKGSERAAGDYNPISAIMRIFKRHDSEGTEVHEILHHTERMMPEPVQRGIADAWARAYAKALADSTGDRRIALEHILPAMLGDLKSRAALYAAFGNGTLEKDTDYQLFNPSEFWAVNATRILGSRYDARTSNSPWARAARQWMSEFVQRVKGWFGLRSDSAILAGLREVMRTDGSRVSETQLSGSTATAAMYAGSKAKGADTSRLKEAEMRHVNGEDAFPGSLIHKDTGWFQAQDGKWRFEFSDREAKGIKKGLLGTVFSKMENGVTRTLSDVLNHPELFSQYPELRDAVITKIAGAGGSYGYDPTAAYVHDIEIGGDQPNSDAMSSLIHEIQHAVQAIEGFSRGSNPRDVPLNPETVTKTVKYHEARRTEIEGGVYVGKQGLLDEIDRRIGVLYEALNYFNDEDVLAAASPAKYLKLRTTDPRFMDMQARSEALGEAIFTDNSPHTIAFTMYEAVFGEIEARSSQARRHLSDAQRKKIVPYSGESKLRQQHAIINNRDGTAFSMERQANEAMDAAANASTTAEVAEAVQAGANARTYNPFRGPLKRLMASASATHLKRLLGGIPTSGIVEHFKRVKVGDKWADFPELEQFNEEIDQLARGMKSKMVRAFTRMAKRYSKFVSEFGSRVIAAAMHNARAASFDVSTFNSLGDAYKNDPLMDYLTRALAQRNLSAEQTASFTAQRKKRIGEITKVWGNWVALGKQEGGQALYREVQQYYKDMYNLTRSALNANIRTRDIGEEYQDRLIEAATLDREKNPDYPDVPAELLPNVYFPYKRYGKFWARVTSKAKKDKKREFHTFESAAERDRFVETRATQLGIKDKAKDSGYFPIGNDISDLQAQNDFTANSKMLKAMFEIVDKATFKDTKGDALEGDALELAIKKLKDSLYQTYLLTLPERSIRKQFIHAEGIPGYSEDVMRNFTTTATAYANQLPKIKYGALLDRKTEEARGRVEGWPSDIRAKMETVISELSGRAYYTLNPPDQSGFVTFVNNAAFLFLLSSAATALVQTTSIPMRVLPNLVSRYGYKETFFMLAKYSPGWNTVGITETLPDGTVLHTAPTFVNAKLQGKTPVNGLDIAGAAKYMQDHDAFEENAVHATMENRKSEVSTSESVGRKAFAATIKALTASFSMAERMSREMTGLMAYELEFNKLVKGGMEAKAAHDMAAKSAVKSVHDTLGNYSAYERPRYLKGDLARFVMLFKMYAVNTTMFFVRNTKTILRNDPNITAKERVAAAHELAGVLLMSGVFSGMTGMPLYTTICAVIDALSDGDDDDDDDGVKDPYAASSADWRFRHLWLPRHFGAITLPGLDGKQHSLSSIAERGLVSELSGVNIASRTAYDNMWFRQGRPGDNMTETLQNYLFDNFSPGLSVGFNMVGAVEDWSKGDIIRGFEKISPALIKGGFTATRLGTEGSRTRAGDLMVDKEDIESFPLLMQVAGFQPTEVATAQQDRIKADKLYKRKEDEREQLVREFTRARYGYDSTQEEILSAYEAMQEFSRKNAGDLDLIITADVLENSARSYLQRKNLTVNGRYVAPGQENFLRSERKEAQ